MRVSTQMFAGNFLSEVDQHQARLYRLQQQLASGKRILDPSDDPAAVQQAADQHAALDANQQYQVNLADARGFVEHSFSVARNIGDLVGQAQQVAERGASDSITPDGRRALAAQLDQLIQEAADNANDQSLGRYTLAGIHSTSAPYTVARDAQGRIVSVTAQAGAVSGEVDRQVGPDTTLKVNLNGSDIFGGAGSPAGSIDLFATLIQMRDDLEANRPDAVRAALTTLSTLHDQVQSQVTVADARAQRLERAQSALEGRQLEVQGTISGLEDVDVAQAALELQSEQAVYQQALQVGNRILSLSLGTFQS